MESFANRRGAKLSDKRCNCGGEFEIIYTATIYDIDHPLDSAKTHEWKGRKYIQAAWTKNGLFVYDSDNLNYVKLEGEFEPADKKYPKERKFVKKP